MNIRIMTQENKTITEPTKEKVRINLREELRGGANQKKDYQLDYGVNQKRRMIERLEQLLENAKELPTETYEYGYYSINTALENYENRMGELLSKAEDRDHTDEAGWEDNADYDIWLNAAEDDEYEEK